VICVVCGGDPCPYGHSQDRGRPWQHGTAPWDTAPAPATWQEMVAAFHAKFMPQTIPPASAPVEIRRPELRAKLVEEEASEAAQAIRRGDLVETIDGLCDVIYVCLGVAVEMGIDLSPFFAEVHRTNMAKEGGGKRGDGKILKPAGWQQPRIAELLSSAKAGPR